MGALEAPQDKYGQEHRTGTSRVEQTDRDHGGAGSSGCHGGAGSSGGHGGAGSSGGHGGAGSSGGHGGVGSSGGHGRWSSGPWPRSAGTLLSPPKISLGKLGGIRSPPRLNRQDSTKQNRKALQGQTDRTGQPFRARQTGQDSPQEPEALLGWLGG